MGPQKRVMLVHSQTGLTAKGYFGWSWTYFLFGWLVPIIRGEIGVGVLHFIVTVLTFGIFQWIMSLLYNKQYMNRMLLAGWRVQENDPNVQEAKLKLGISG